MHFRCGYFWPEMSRMVQMGPKHPKWSKTVRLTIGDNFGSNLQDWQEYHGSFWSRMGHLGLSPAMGDPISTMYGLIEWTQIIPVWKSVKKRWIFLKRNWKWNSNIGKCQNWSSYVLLLGPAEWKNPARLPLGSYLEATVFGIVIDWVTQTKDSREMYSF